MLPLCGRLRGAAGAAKTRACRAGLSTSRAKEACADGRLRRLCGACNRSLWIRGQRPNQRDDPADESPAAEDVEDQDGGEVGFVARKKSGKKVQEKRDEPEDGVEMKEGNEPHGRCHHEARSAMTVFYHELKPFALVAAISFGDVLTQQSLR